MSKKDQKKKSSSSGEPVKRDPTYVPRLLLRYQERVAPALREKFAYKNVMMVPSVEKVIVNMGLGAAVANPKLIESAFEDLRAITGQHPVVRRARKSIASFKLRAGMPVGVKVTLRRASMWEFLDRLITVALPRVRDFKGVSPKGFDGHGNFTMGVKEQIIFPEIDYDKIDALRGLDITITTSAKSNEEGRALLEAFKFPFRN